MGIFAQVAAAVIEWILENVAKKAIAFFNQFKAKEKTEVDLEALNNAKTNAELDAASQAIAGDAADSSSK